MNAKAHLYVRVRGTRCLVEVMDEAISIEQQPEGPQRLFKFNTDLNHDSAAATVYSADDDTWDLPALETLIARYESAIHDVRELGTWEAEGGNPPDMLR